MKRLLVLRPEPGASRTVERARTLGLNAVSVPLFEIAPVEWEVPNAAEFDGLLLTSANAVQFGGSNLKRLGDLPVYAVGEATALAARSAGLEVRATGELGVERLLGSLPADLRLLHLSGADRKHATNVAQAVTPIVVYQATPVEAPDLSAANGVIALIHSPRAGRRFAELVDDRASISIAAISPAAADVAGSGWKSVVSADRPTGDALLALAARLCNNR
jgi:uroporphyrinogen-III synthase